MGMIAWIISFDYQAEHYFDLHRTPALTMFFEWFTGLGDARVIIVLAISAAIVLLRHHRFAYVAGLFTSIAGSFTFSYLLKLVVARGRPLPSLAAIDAPGYSFPSLHAACAMAMYGFLAFMIWKLLRPSQHRIPLIVAIGILVTLIGFSRLYLGVHYPSDVIVGYIIGTFFVWLGTITTVRLERQTKNSVWRSRAQSSR
jgi:membrane-associated phospholipid phosphatase